MYHSHENRMHVLHMQDCDVVSQVSIGHDRRSSYLMSCAVHQSFPGISFARRFAGISPKP